MGKNKDLRKRIAGEKVVIAKHRAWIDAELAKPYPDRRGIAKWEKDIARHERILVKLQAKLPGGK